MRRPPISCSGLKRHCRHDKIISAQHESHPNAVTGQREGNEFGKYVENWANGVGNAKPNPETDAWRWYVYMRDTWPMPAGTRSEVILGLDSAGDYVEVAEPEPHKYERVDGSSDLLTAGRADLCWTRGVVAYVGDLKRSAWRYGEPLRHPQLMALGLAFASKRKLHFLRVGLYDARDGAWEWGEAVDLREDGVYMLAEIRTMATMDDEPHPGPHCGGCYERRLCGAGKEYLEIA